MPNQVVHPVPWDASLASQQIHVCTRDHLKDQKLKTHHHLSAATLLLLVVRSSRSWWHLDLTYQRNPQSLLREGIGGSGTGVLLSQGTTSLTTGTEFPNSAPPQAQLSSQGREHLHLTHLQPFFSPSQVGWLGMGGKVRESRDWADPNQEKSRSRSGHL